MAVSISVDPVDLTKQLLQLDTSTGKIKPEDVSTIVALLAQLGFQVSTVELDGLTHIRADAGPSDAALALAFVGHYDVVPAGSGWNHLPFAAAEVDGVIYGRGASDMKSGDAAMLCAALDLASHGIRSSVFLPADEETASAGMPALLQQTNEHFDFCICGEPTSKQVLGDCIKVGRRGVLQGTITLHGTSGHAAYAERTRNVIDDVPALLQALAEAWNDECYGTRTTVTVTNLTTDSLATNVIPSRVELTYDARFSPLRTSDELLTELRQRLDATGVSYDLHVKKRTEPYFTDGRNEASSSQARFISQIITCIERICGVTPAITCDGGASDARFVAWRGVPTIELGVPHGNMHGPDEFVRAADIRQLMQVYTAIGLSLVGQ